MRSFSAWCSSLSVYSSILTRLTVAAAGCCRCRCRSRSRCQCQCLLNIAKYFTVPNDAIMKNSLGPTSHVWGGQRMCGGSSGRRFCRVSSVFLPQNCLHILMKLPHDGCHRPGHAPGEWPAGAEPNIC